MNFRTVAGWALAVVVGLIVGSALVFVIKLGTSPITTLPAGYEQPWDFKVRDIKRT